MVNFIRNLFGSGGTSGIQEPKSKKTEESSPPPREPGELIQEIAARIKPQNITGDSRILREVSWHRQFYDQAKQYPQDLELSIVKDFSAHPQQTREDAEAMFAAQTKVRGISCDKDRYLSMVDAYLEALAKFQASETVNSSPTIARSLFEAQQNISGTAGGIPEEKLLRTADETKPLPPQFQGTGKTEAGSSETIKPQDAKEVIQEIAARIKPQDITGDSHIQREISWNRQFCDQAMQYPEDPELDLLKHFLGFGHPNRTLEKAESLFETQVNILKRPYDKDRFFSMVNSYFEAFADFQLGDTIPELPFPKDLKLDGRPVIEQDFIDLAEIESITGPGNQDFRREMLKAIILNRENLQKPWKDGLAAPPSDKEPPADSYARLAESLRASNIDQILQVYSGEKGYREWNRDLAQLALLGKDSDLDSMYPHVFLGELSQGKILTFRGNKFSPTGEAKDLKSEFFTGLAFELNKLIEKGPTARETLQDINNKFNDMRDNPLALSLNEAIQNLDTYIKLKDDAIEAIVNKNPKK